MDITLSAEIYILIFIVTLLAKIVGTLIGGGGFVTQPFLILLGIPPQIALANDISTSAGMNITSMHVFKKHKMISINKLSWWIPGMILGPLIGVKLLQFLPSDFIKWTVTLYCLIACILLLTQHKKINKEPLKNIYLRRCIAIVSSFIIGAYIGFSGAGAAFLTGTALLLTHKISTKEMTAMRHVLHFFPSFTACIAYLYIGWIDLKLASTLFSACLIAGYIGSHMVIKLPEKTVRYIFCSSGILMSLAVIFQEIL